MLQGTRYLASNPQIIQLGLGIQGAKNVAKGGFILGIVVATGIEITEFILNDQKTMYDLVGSVGVEAVKGGLAALVAYGAGALVGSAITVAVLPLGVMLFAALIVSSGLNYLDDSYQIKSKVIAALKAMPENLSEGIYTIRAESLSQLGALKNIVNKDTATLRRFDQMVKMAITQLMGRR